MRNIVLTFRLPCPELCRGVLSVYFLCTALAPSASPLFNVNSAEAQTTHNLDVIFQRGIPDTSLRYWGSV